MIESVTVKIDYLAGSSRFAVVVDGKVAFAHSIEALDDLGREFGASSVRRAVAEGLDKAGLTSVSAERREKVIEGVLGLIVESTKLRWGP